MGLAAPQPVEYFLGHRVEPVSCVKVLLNILCIILFSICLLIRKLNSMKSGALVFLSLYLLSHSRVLGIVNARPGYA